MTDFFRPAYAVNTTMSRLSLEVGSSKGSTNLMYVVLTSIRVHYKCNESIGIVKYCFTTYRTSSRPVSYTHLDVYKRQN